MAYRDPIGDNAQLLRKTIAGVTDFSGRSRRTEVVYYWIAGALVGVVLNFAVLAILPFQASLLFSNALQLLLMVPMFALFVRRLHDQERSGKWALLLPLSVLLSVPELVTEMRSDVSEMIAQRTTPMSITAGLIALAVFVLCLLRGTEGPNRYGPDPRLSED